MRRLLFMALAAVLLVTGLFCMFSGPCGRFGGDGCLASHTLRHIAVTGDTIVTDAAGKLRIAGIHYRPGGRDRLLPKMVMVTIDPQTGEEISRLELDMEGRPDQLRLSPQEDRFAISCNALYVCDLPGGNKPKESEAMMFDSGGKRLWSTGVEHRLAPPDSDGRAFDLAFSASGRILFAHLAHMADGGDVILTKQRPIEGPAGRLDAFGSQAYGGLAGRLGLPDGFVPFLRHNTAISPDGTRIAVLARRFSGPGTIRAAIRVFDIEKGGLLASHDIDEDLAPVIVWQPDRDAVIVALADAVAADAGTQLRLYDAGGSPR